jgi:hypothetical protein
VDVLKQACDQAADFSPISQPEIRSKLSEMTNNKVADPFYPEDII